MSASNTPAGEPVVPLSDERAALDILTKSVRRRMRSSCAAISPGA